MEIENKRHPLTDDDIDRIAIAVSEKAKQSFYVDAEAHYNSHKRLDRLLEAYDTASNAFTKAFIALMIIGAFVLAGFGFWKGH